MCFFIPSQHISTLQILGILDDFTQKSLQLEPYVNLSFATPSYLPFFLKKYDLLLVESAWLGNQAQWKYKIANYPNHPERNQKKLIRLINWAKNQRIPTVFWNKEDPFHFNQFIQVAKHFDFIFTTDANQVEQYQTQCPNSKVAVLSFAFQPQIHYPAPFTQIKSHASIFIGSYLSHMHPERKKWQDLCFHAATPFGLTIIDRHSERAKKQAMYQFPQIQQADYREAVNYEKTALLYHQFQQAINVNTITHSPTMFSRRLIEIMACNRLVVSNPSQAINHLFPNLCETIETQEQANALFSQLQHGYTPDQIEKVHYAQQHVYRHYTIQSWLKSILIHCNIDHAYLNNPTLQFPQNSKDMKR